MAKKKAATLMYEKIKMSENYSTKNMCIDNRVIDNKLDARLKSDPICALQELCMSRDWRLPEYKFFDEGDSKTFTYSVECTVLSFTVRGK
jgi:dsRNA-specific ribonuclease